MSTTAVLWIRVSSDLQAQQGFSLDSQEDLLKKAASGYDVLRIFKVTESARISENRKRFKEMVELVKAEKIGHLFAWSHDRLGRHYKDFFTLQSLVDDDDVAIHLVESGKVISRESAISDRTMFQIMAAFAESENRKRAADTRRGMLQKARSGGVPHKAPIGYLNTVDTADANPDPTRRKRIVIQDPERAPHMAWAFTEFAKGGWSLSTMSDELNRRGMTTRPVTTRPAGPISVITLHKMLTNPFYTGTHRSCGEEHAGTYEPIITRDVWTKVQEQLDHNRTFSYSGVRKWFCFKPFLRCGYCGSGITAFESAGHIYYVCSESLHKQDTAFYQAKFGSDHCPLKSWREEKVNELIEAEIGRFYIDDFIVTQVRERLKKTSAEDETFETRELRRLMTERTRRERHLKLSYQDRLDGILPVEDFKAVQRETQARLDEILSEIKHLGHQNVKAKEQGSLVLELLHGVKTIYQQAGPYDKRKLLEIMLAYVLLRHDAKHSVHWNWPFSSLFFLGQEFRKNEARVPNTGSG
jgi:DNA invertase Pin-like site-specific DNA recombinase